MKKFIFPVLLFFVHNFLLAQSLKICSIPSDFEQAIADIVHDEVSKKEVIELIDSIYINLQLNNSIQVQSCTDSKCRNNAYASMDLNGNRFIKFDSIWMHKAFLVPPKIAYKVILAHEIGHHLSGHTLSLNFIEYGDAYNYCDLRSKNYNPKYCIRDRAVQYSKFLFTSRKQELQADRFCGYISFLLKISVEDIQKTFSTFSDNKDDKLSTHPSLDKRIKSIIEGFKLAQKDSKNGTIASLLEIKNYKADFKDIVNYDSKRNKLMRKVQAIMRKSSQNVINNSSVDLSTISGPTYNNTAVINFTKLHKIENSIEFKNDNIFWRKNNSGIFYADLPEIKYLPKTACLIKNNTLYILSFEDNFERIIYSSSLEEDEINFQEIDVLITAIIDNGLKRAYSSYTKD